MKKTTITLLILLAIPFFGFAQIESPKKFTVTGIKNVLGNLIVSCRDGFGRTVHLGSGKQRVTMNKGTWSLNKIGLGYKITIDFDSLKVTAQKWITKDDGNIYYYPDSNVFCMILKPVFKDNCCVIKKILKSKFVNNHWIIDPNAEYVVPDQDFTNENIVYFKLILIIEQYASVETGLQLKGEYDDPYWGGVSKINRTIPTTSQFAVLDSKTNDDIKKNIFYTYGMESMSRSTYNLLDSLNQTADSAQVQTQQFNTSAPPVWEMLPDPILTGMTGQLSFQMPANISYAHLKVFNSGETKIVASVFGNGSSKLLPGNYDLLLDKYSIKNVPVQQGKTTRLKLGVLNYSPRGPVSISDANGQTISMAGPFKIVLPPGIYHINGEKEYGFVIKDGEITAY